MSLICVAPADLDRVWPLVEGLLDAAYERVDFLTPDLLTWLKQGEGLLWVVGGDERFIMALTTSVIERRSGMALRLWALGGEHAEQWVDYLPEIERYGRSMGCVKVVFDGRRGWGQLVPEYRQATVCYEKVL